MPSPKLIIPVSEVKPGDAIQLHPYPGILFVYDRLLNTDNEATLCVLGLAGDHRALVIDRQVNLAVVGFTNRKAKRLRGKMARRQRFADRNVSEVVG